jgi:uncharacterized membrane protein
MLARIAIICAVMACNVGFAKADYLSPTPDTDACSVMRDDVNPNMESAQNREDIEYLFNGTYRQGRDGMQCRTLQRDRTKLKNDSALHLSGMSKYSRERVFAWGRLCLLDWCDSSSGGSSKKSEPEEGSGPSRETDRQGGGGGTRPPAPPPVPQNYYAAKFCNKSGVPKIDLAIVRYFPENDRPLLEGWWQIANGQCLTLRKPLGKYTSGWIAYHAEGGGMTWWGKKDGQLFYCVNKRKMDAIVLWTKCVADLRLAGFRKRDVKKDETIEVDFNK